MTNGASWKINLNPNFEKEVMEAARDQIQKAIGPHPRVEVRPLPFKYPNCRWCNRIMEEQQQGFRCPERSCWHWENPKEGICYCLNCDNERERALEGFNFFAYCDECQEKRSVSCSRSEAQTGNPVRVIAFVCGHTWTLSPAESQKVREQINAAV